VVVWVAASAKFDAGPPPNAATKFSNSRLTKASMVHASGGWAGVVGVAPASGPRAQPTRFDTTPVTTSATAWSGLAGAGPIAVTVGEATGESAADDAVARLSAATVSDGGLAVVAAARD
jgi:hypothetical protein